MKKSGEPLTRIAVESGSPEIFFQRSEDLTAIQMQADNPSSQSLSKMSKIRHTRDG